MSKLKNLVFQVLLFFFFHINSICSGLPADFQSLLEFRKGIHSDPSGQITSTWTPSPSAICPPFYGVSCDVGGNISAVDLSGLNLTGEVKFSTLSNLRYLRNLSLAGNRLSGRFSGGAASLNHINLAGNLFYGPIPGKIADLWNLNYLNLSNNNFTGGVPAGIQNLQQLRTLDLSFNRLTGDITILFSDLRNVEHLDLSGNGFYGRLPTDPANVTGLSSTLTYLNFSGNAIEGEFFANDLLIVFQNLEVLDVSFNRIEGKLSEVFVGMERLKILRAAGNLLNGNLPGELFGTRMPLQEIDLSSNQLEGSVPSSNLTTLNILNLSSNALSGALPSKLGSCILVDLSENGISGNLSEIKTWGQTLEVIDLSSNLFSGSIPDEISQFKSLFSLKIRNNSLEESLPSNLKNLPKLSTLDLSENKLTGPLLPGLIMSPTLTSLNLSNNNFTGPILLQNLHSTKSLATPSNFQLQSLDLSNNQLSDSLAPEIGNLQRLQILNLQNNNLSGELPSELTRLDLLELLDLSLNHFQGKIPDLNLQRLKVLNVSYNNLSGKVPEALQKLPRSSFYPGNALLVIPGETDTGNNSRNINNDKIQQGHNRPSFQVLIVIGCVGAVLLIFSIIAAFYALKLQKFCSRNGIKGHVNGIDVKLGEFGHRTIVKTEKNTHGSKSMSFSNELLLSSASMSMPSCDELALDNRKNRGISGKSQCVESCTSSQCNELDISPPDRLVGELIILDSSLLLTVEDLSCAPAEVLGRSSQGTTYKAALNSGHILKVKWLRTGSVKSKKEFVKEAKRIASIRHVNIVSLRACYCDPNEQKRRLLITDYVAGDSLALHLYGSSSSIPRKLCNLSGGQRLRTAIDIARCLYFLHHERGLAHGNLKPTNVILTGPDLSVHLTDCSLHGLMNPDGITQQLVNLRAHGYRGPEPIPSKSGPSFKCDVYSLGVIMMEMITGRSAGDIISGQSGAVDLPDWVQMCAREGRAADCFDKNIIEESEDAQRLLEELLGVSLSCVLPVNQRPDIRTVLQDLSTIKF